MKKYRTIYIASDGTEFKWSTFDADNEVVAAKLGRDDFIEAVIEDGASYEQAVRYADSMKWKAIEVE